MTRALFVIALGELLGVLVGAALWHYAGWSAWMMLAGFVLPPVALFAFLICLIMRETANGGNPFQ